jgi:hypothetical protein
MYPINFNAVRKKTQGVTIATEENEMMIYNSTSQMTVHERLFQGTKKDPLKLTQILLEKSKQSPLTYSEKKYVQAQKDLQYSFRPQISERSQAIVENLRRGLSPKEESQHYRPYDSRKMQSIGNEMDRLYTSRERH